MLVCGVMDKKYKAISRKYRPQSFKDVVGQEAVVTTLKNAIKHNLVAHAYLFCGSRGIGKTTLARLFAKALNCENLSQECEPCNSCSSCQEIAECISVDVIEIDGASNRGIDDVRKINETISYSPSMGKYKIYIVDEVHMLTKEAFNALLKTLEDPPEKVKFFFATTEPHKVLSTIISRTQRFYLKTIPLHTIVNKLNDIIDDLNREVSENALYLIAKYSEGSLRDAQSLLDQILCFHNEAVDEKTIYDALGTFPNDLFFNLDNAMEKQDQSYAFTLVETIISSGKDLSNFLTELIEHFRNILAIKMSTSLELSTKMKQDYTKQAEKYSLDQCSYILGLLIQKTNHTRSIRSYVEMLLLKILNSKNHIPLESLIQRLLKLEADMEKNPTDSIHTKKTDDPPVISQQPKQAVTKDSKQETQPTIQKTKATKSASHYETLLRFASVELEGSYKKPSL